MSSVKLLTAFPSKAKRTAGAPAHAPGDFGIFVSQDDVVTVFLMTSTGDAIDGSNLATLSPVPSSSDTTVITLDTPVGMTCKMHGVKRVTPVPPPAPARHADLTFTATMNDPVAFPGGPFSMVLPVDVNDDPTTITGIKIVPGVPTTR